MTSQDNLRSQLSSAVKSILDRLEDSGVVLPGDLRHWKAFRKRETLEAKLIRKVGIVQRAQLGHIMELLGDPPDVGNLSEEFWDSAGAELIAAIQPILIETQIEQAREILDDNPAIGVNWTAVNQNAIDWARKYTFDLVKGINATSRDLLQTSVSSYFEQQMTIGQLEGMLTSTFGPVRAEIISVTEITRAASQGEQVVLDQLHEQGIEMEATWETNDDELVCDICGPLDGINTDEFDSDGQPQWGDLGPPPAHPRCRCWFNIGFAEKK